MSRSQHITRELALGAAVNTAVLGTYFGALVIWSRLCEAHKCRTH